MLACKCSVLYSHFEATEMTDNWEEIHPINLPILTVSVLMKIIVVFCIFKVICIWDCAQNSSTSSSFFLLAELLNPISRRFFCYFSKIFYISEQTDCASFTEEKLHKLAAKQHEWRGVHGELGNLLKHRTKTMNGGIESRNTKSSKVDKALKWDDSCIISLFEAVGVSKDLKEWLLVLKFAHISAVGMLFAVQWRSVQDPGWAWVNEAVLIFCH